MTCYFTYSYDTTYYRPSLDCAGYFQESDRLMKMKAKVNDILQLPDFGKFSYSMF